MDAEIFRRKIKRPNKFFDTFNYIICFFFLGLGIYFGIRIFNYFNTFPEPSKYFVLIVPLIPLFFGLYGLWRIPRAYLVKQLNTIKPINEKRQAIDAYLTNYKMIWKQVEDNFISVRLRNKFFTQIDAKFYFDDNKILFNAEGADAYGARGIIDFGIGKRVMNKIERHLELLLCNDRPNKS